MVLALVVKCNKVYTEKQSWKYWRWQSLQKASPVLCSEVENIFHLNTKRSYSLSLNHWYMYFIKRFLRLFGNNILVLLPVAIQELNPSSNTILHVINLLLELLHWHNRSFLLASPAALFNWYRRNPPKGLI